MSTNEAAEIWTVGWQQQTWGADVAARSMSTEAAATFPARSAASAVRPSK